MIVGVCAFEPMYGVIRYALIALPPVEVGAVQLSAAPWSRGEPVTPVGAPGTVAEGEGLVEIRASSKSVVPTASFQSCSTARFAVRV